MMRSWVLVLFALLMPSAVSAETILFAGDSIAKLVAPALQARMPEALVVNAGVNGDRSTNLNRFYLALSGGPFDVVVLQYGTNDYALAGVTPAASLRNLRTMARAAKRTGARVYILTPPPQVCKHAADLCSPGAGPYENLTHGNAHTLAVTDLLKATRLGRGIALVDLRDRWHAVPNGWWAASDFFGVHPNADAAVLMAEWIAAAIEADCDQ
jgi:lysophospholipase L1-like esterase